MVRAGDRVKDVMSVGISVWDKMQGRHLGMDRGIYPSPHDFQILNIHMVYIRVFEEIMALETNLPPPPIFKRVTKLTIMYISQCI